MTDSEERAALRNGDLSAVETLRRPLEKFFRWRGVREPQELADETIVRLLGQCSNGTPVDDFRVHAHGIAERALQDEIERGNRESGVQVEGALNSRFERDGLGEERLEALQHCIRTVFTQKERKLLKAYHDGHASARGKMASGLGISIDALRLRVLKTHRRLEACLRTAEKQKRQAPRWKPGDVSER